MNRHYIAALALTLGGVRVQAQEPGLRELFCRGGSTGLSFVVDKDPSPLFPDPPPKYVRMKLRYRVSATFKVGQIQTLDAGSCTWDMQFDAPKPPGEVLFDVEADAQEQIPEGSKDTSPRAAIVYTDTASIRRYLSVPDLYWVFFVPDRGEPLSISMGPVEPDLSNLFSDPPSDPPTTVSGPPTPKGRTGTKRAPGTLKGPDGTGTKGGSPTTTSIARAPLTLVNVGQVMDKFTIQFTARPNATPSVTYSGDEPAWEGTAKRWIFPGATFQGTYQQVFAAQIAGGSSSGIKASYSAWNRMPIERGKVYYYIVTVPAGNGTPEEQIKGTFTTIAQRAQVEFTSIEILYTRHESLHFAFLAGDRSGTALGNVYLGDANGSLDWQKGMHNLSGQVLDIPSAPDQLRVLVWGDDVDPGLVRSGGNLPPEYDWNLRPGTNTLGDMNVAKVELNIGASPTERSLYLPFEMRSVDGNSLMFIVRGRIRVTRE